MEPADMHANVRAAICVNSRAIFSVIVRPRPANKSCARDSKEAGAAISTFRPILSCARDDCFETLGRSPLFLSL